jgi:hypothetical protein
MEGKKARSTLPAQHLLDRVLQGQKNTTFFTGMMISMN